MSRAGNQNGNDLRRQQQYIRISTTLLAVLFLLTCSASSFGQAKRIVVIKCDGLPYDLVDRLVEERDPITGKSTLPWIERIFYQQGSRLSNFYVRGMSLSAPSWSLIDTGQHLQIKGNVEFDRFTLHTYDYLNFFPLFVNRISSSRIDMPGVEVLDSLGIPLLPDAFPHDERYVTLSLFVRGIRYSTIQNGLQNKFKKSPKELFDEWTMGLEVRSVLTDQLVRELVGKLDDPKIKYLDLFIGDFDHIAHHNNDLQSQRDVLKQMDSAIGQVWTAINKSALAKDTALILVSDHGFNTDEKFYSQGFNLVKLLGSRPGGGHHVITKRRLMLDYSIKGLNPLVPLITTTTNDTYYLKGQSTQYPTALLDFDGNERASIHLRNSDLNELQILLQQLQRNDLPQALRSVVTREFFALRNRRKAQWQNTVAELTEELSALQKNIEAQRTLWEAKPKKFSKEEIEAGKDDATIRIFVQLDRWQRAEREYLKFLVPLRRLIDLSADSFEPAKIKVQDVIPEGSMGERNSIFQLQNYVVGIAPSGLVLNSYGVLNRERSYVRLNYFDLLHDVAVRNGQKGVTNRPVDLIATRLTSDLLPQLHEYDGLASEVVWVSSGRDKQALLLFQKNARGELRIRYQPIRTLTQDSNGRISFEKAEWQPGFPLHILEDPKFGIPVEQRIEWLNGWHSELEWFGALHRTEYSNGLIGLHEELILHPIESLSVEDSNLTADQRSMRKFMKRQRELCEADLLVVANNHWNFDVRGFNPGGNHGSFFRISTHSIFMIAGGSNTQLPQGRVIEEPYDSLSFVPTMLALTGNLRDDSTPVPSLWEKGFRRFPGRVVKEFAPGRHDDQKTSVTGASASP